VNSTNLEKNKTQPAICTPAIIKANMKRILVRGITLEGDFQCRTVKKITRGAVNIVNQYIKIETVATSSAMES
jgi:hypothetical protein